MLQVSVVFLTIVLYLGLLFVVASVGDRLAARGRRPLMGRGRRSIYALSLAVYCTSWTFLGSVGLSAASGWSFLTIYIGPILLFGPLRPLVGRVIRLAKEERITSMADFVAARYGKSPAVAATVTLIAVIGLLPYIALQLKAVSISVETLIAHLGNGTSAFHITGLHVPMIGDIALLVALAMALFAVLFGTRHADATEHQEGMMLAIAAESLVKLGAFLIVGLYVTFGLYGGIGSLARAVAARPDIAQVFTAPLDGATWIVQSGLSFIAALLLPRQFHVAVTENTDPSELKRAAWLFPLYLVLINLFVVPVAAAGLLRFGPGVDADTFVLALPMAAGADVVALIAFTGALSAATAMVIVEAVALSIMISNDLVLPPLLRRRDAARPAAGAGADTGDDMGRIILMVRRAAILALMLGAYGYYRAVGNAAALAQTGLLSFAAIAQIAPAFFGGLIWRRGTARGAMAGMIAGFAVWAYTLLVPNIVATGLLPADLLSNGPFGLWLLRPQALFAISFDPFIHGVFWSLAINLTTFVFVSLMRPPGISERLQSSIFVPSDIGPAPTRRPGRTAVTVGDLKATIARYLGEERVDEAFAGFAARQSESGAALPAPGAPADAALLRFSERLLASAIGSASSRLVLSLLIRRRDPTAKRAHRLLDDATAAIRYNRDLLQTAIEEVEEGIAVFDRDLTLSLRNRQFLALMDLPPELGHVGVPLRAILIVIAKRGDMGPGRTDGLIDARMSQLAAPNRTTLERRIGPLGRVLEVHSNPMPDGGVVLMVVDMTERVRAAETLARANETLEHRVRERTAELERLNAELAAAKAAAEAADLGKTRFLAAAGHDILQPLNAARLYASTLAERADGSDYAELAEKVEASLESVDEIIAAVLDISQLDAGGLKPAISRFRLADVFATLAVEFEPIARGRGLALRIVPTSAVVTTDRRLLRRLLQNLISNAIQYTAKGGVVVGCRRRGRGVRIEVVDSGIGIAEEKLAEAFREFSRLEPAQGNARGLGLGLSIVDRIAHMLTLPLDVRSRPGHGSRFAVSIAQAEWVAAEPPAATAAPVGPPRHRLVIAVIDNEPAILDGMQVLLSGWGCTIVTATSAAELEAKAAEASLVPQLALVDYHLDDTTGLEAVARLRARYGAALPSILITADRSPGLRTAAAAAQIGVLNKPVKPAALRALLAHHGLNATAAE
ncbi:PAS domain-containing hybrid sensor histidine kinase/response regulator [Segnochrobactrum spirostomi]|uniref:histidine kinase n=1 Tax=Segnochrobactrum spirostomi TaxID=2608987 RepID=A0A6A7Y8G7_9HYPH|nr:hybrid sensor histidine kinase/response regulator [Segnochrobactrum spirostomi]MQT13779.1 hybrid sensor histidine kinase/response regulator [Segnochrobactrum spirostomi]